MRIARLRSLAKINLDLRVLGKRADGYHELRTVFQTITLADTIDVEYSPARRLRVEIGGAVEIPDNLIARATEALADEAGIRGRIRFQLTKRIPMGGGLGGGSSNAAAVLLALPVLAGKRLPMAKLSEIGASLGSDIPFFLHGGAALGVGRGTELYPLPAVHSHGLLVNPGVHVSTAEAYRDLNRPAISDYETLTSEPPAFDTSSFQSLAWAMENGPPVERWKLLGSNDFELAVFARFPQLQSIRAKLRSLGGCPARMSGSGSALFGLFENREAAKRARGAFPEQQALTFELVDRRRYRAMWRRQLSEHCLTNETWPPLSRYER